MTTTGHSRSRWRAARNLTRLYSGRVSPQDARAANPWRSQDKDYQKEFLAINQLLANMEQLDGDADLAEWKQSAASPVANRYHWSRLATAACLVVALALGLITTLKMGDQATSNSNILRYVTRTGEQKTVHLADNSVITMNTGTQMLVDIGDTRRRILLERGEAYFDVAHDPLRPFQVDMGERSITALGTEFNIHRSPEKISVAVMDGVIAFHQKDESVISNAPMVNAPQGQTVQMVSPPQHRLAAGWVAEFDLARNQVSSYASSAIDNYQSWRSGMITISGEPLYKVVQELNRYSAKKILIEDADIVNLKMYGVLRVNRINTTLSNLEKTLPIKTIHHFDRIVLVGSK